MADGVPSASPAPSSVKGCARRDKDRIPAASFYILAWLTYDVEIVDYH